MLNIHATSDKYKLRIGYFGGRNMNGTITRVKDAIDNFLP
jgi:hypothetical protein